MNLKQRTKRVAAAGALLVAGAGVGAAVAVTGSASAAGEAASSAVGKVADQVDPSRSINPDEHLLTGTKLEKVTAAAKEAYPGATIQRVETDSEGVYEAHVVTADGQELIVQVGADYTVTGTQSFGDHGPHTGPGSDGDGGAA